MANKSAPYKDENTMHVLEQWWQRVLDMSKTFDRLDSMYEDYIGVAMAWGNYEEVMNITDFQRCIYKMGITRISTTPEAAYQTYHRLEHWRPSDDQTMRFKPKEMTWA
jgi:hypothetical protein